MNRKLLKGFNNLNKTAHLCVNSISIVVRYILKKIIVILKGVIATPSDREWLKSHHY